MTNMSINTVVEQNVNIYDPDCKQTAFLVQPKTRKVMTYCPNYTIIDDNNNHHDGIFLDGVAYRVCARDRTAYNYIIYLEHPKILGIDYDVDTYPYSIIYFIERDGPNIGKYDKTLQIQTLNHIDDCDDGIYRIVQTADMDTKKSRFKLSLVVSCDHTLKSFKFIEMDFPIHVLRKYDNVIMFTIADEKLQYHVTSVEGNEVQLSRYNPESATCEKFTIKFEEKEYTYRTIHIGNDKYLSRD